MIVVFSHHILFNLTNPCLSLVFPSPAIRIIPSRQFSTVSTAHSHSRGSPQSFFAVLSHKYEFADSAEALLSDLSLPNVTTISPAEKVLFVSEGCVFDTVGDAGGEANGAERVGDRGRNVDFCWLAEAMMDCFANKVGRGGYV